MLAIVVSAGMAHAAAPAYTVSKTIALEAPDRWDYVSFDAASRRVFVAHSDHTDIVDASTGAILGKSRRPRRRARPGRRPPTAPSGLSAARRHRISCLRPPPPSCRSKGIAGRNRRRRRHRRSGRQTRSSSWTAMPTARHCHRRSQQNRAVRQSRSADRPSSPLPTDGGHLYVNIESTQGDRLAIDLAASPGDRPLPCARLLFAARSGHRST